MNKKKKKKARLHIDIRLHYRHIYIYRYIYTLVTVHILIAGGSPLVDCKYSVSIRSQNCNLDGCGFETYHCGT